MKTPTIKSCLVLLLVIQTVFGQKALAQQAPSRDETVAWLNEKFAKYMHTEITLSHTVCYRCKNDKHYSLSFGYNYLQISCNQTYNISESCGNCSKRNDKNGSWVATIPFSTIVNVYAFKREDSSWYWVNPLEYHPERCFNVSDVAEGWNYSQTHYDWLRFRTFGNDVTFKYSDGTTSQDDDITFPFYLTEPNMEYRLKDAFNRLNELFPRKKETY